MLANLTKFGFRYFRLHLKLNSTDLKQKEALFDFLIMKKGLVFSNIQFGYDIFGFELYKTLLYLKTPNRKRIDQLKSFARSYPRIWDIIETFGKWQLELDIESKGHEDYYKIMDEIQNKFSDILSHYDTLYIRKERKFLFSIFD